MRKKAGSLLQQEIVTRIGFPPRFPLHQVLIWQRHSVIIFISGRSFPGTIPIITIIVIIIIVVVVVVANVVAKIIRS